MTIQKNQIYKLPSGAVVQVGNVVAGTKDDWNCVFKHALHEGYMVCFSGAFLRKFGEVWA